MKGIYKVKKALRVILLVLGLSLIVSCGDGNGDSDGEQLDGSVVMKAEVKAINDKIEVEVIESEYTFGVHWVITSEGTKYFDKDGNKIDRDDIKCGDVVEIRYSGQVMMSYPPQIVAAKITVIR